MPRKTRVARKQAAAGAEESVDVVIVTAVKEEYEALLKVDTGATSSWEFPTTKPRRQIALRTYQGSHGGPLRVAAVLAPRKGQVAALNAAIPLVVQYRAHCLAMCGVCAGRRGVVELGDVIIADRLWNHESGKRTVTRLPSGARRERFKPSNEVYSLPASWEEQARFFKHDARSHWLLERPRPYLFQMEWVLERLLLNEDPAIHPERGTRCAAYAKVMELLRARKWIYQNGLRLTKTGSQYIQRRRTNHPDGLPEPPPFDIRVGSMATGSAVRRDQKIFDVLSNRDENVMGLEMEASAIAAFAHDNELAYTIVMKGVSDFADEEKDDQFKSFAARAAAECLLAFLRQHLPPASPASGGAAPPLVETRKALSRYKRACCQDPDIRCLDLRALEGIAGGSHQTELDLLEFAVAPSLLDEAEQDGSLEQATRRELRRGNLPLARRRELEERLARLENAPWSPEGAHGSQRTRPVSIAEELSRHRRLIVIGEPGAGKSFLTRLLFLSCMNDEVGRKARRLLSRDDPFNPNALSAVESLRELLPIRLQLGKLGAAPAERKGLTLEGFLRHQLGQHAEAKGLLAGLGDLLAAGRLFLICDGLDEVSEAQRKGVVAEVEAFLKQYPEVRFLLTSRPHGYHPRVAHLRHAQLAPLNDRQQHYLVSKLYRLVETRQGETAASLARAHRRTHALLSAIHSNNREWMRLSSNPLLLTLSALTYTDEQGLPRQRVFVFENFIRTLFGEWHAVASASEIQGLVNAWAAVASRMVQEERRGGATEDLVLSMLAEVLAGRPMKHSIDEQRALQLALEAGLVRKQAESISFWHPTFAEFLAAYALTRGGRGAARRILEAEKLSPVVLQFCASLLDLRDQHEEVDALADGLLARDGQGAGRLLRTGLRAVSDCLAEGVSFSSSRTEQIWAAWAEVLDRTPPSQLWQDFEKLTRHAAPQGLPVALVERFARIDSRGFHEAREGLARVLAPHAAVCPAAREACARGLRHGERDPLKLHGAFGLATAGDWSDEVIDTLGRFGSTREFTSSALRELVLQGGASLFQRLRELVRSGPASPEEKEDEKTFDLRLSAAFLLALHGDWNESVAHVVGPTLQSRSSTLRLEEAKAVIRSCAHHASVQKSLLVWSGEDSTLGNWARERIQDVAPLIEHLPEQVLQRTAHAAGAVLRQLEDLLVSIGEERRTLADTLRRWLRHEREEQRLSAVRILRQLVPRDAQLHEALQRGMQPTQADAASRARWAIHALGLTKDLNDTALKTLLECARSPVQGVRDVVYGGLSHLHWAGASKWREAWLECASSVDVPAAARLDATLFIARTREGPSHVVPLLRALLDVEDVAVRWTAAKELFWQDPRDARAALLVAEEAAHTGDYKHLRSFRYAKPLAPEVRRAILRVLLAKMPPRKSQDKGFASSELSSLFEGLAAEDPECVEELAKTLDDSGQIGDAAELALLLLAKKHSTVREQIRQHLEHLSRNDALGRRLCLISLGLDHEETAPLAVQAARDIAPQELSQRQFAWLARRLHGAKADEDAARLWKLVLGGEDLASILRAVEALIWYFPGDTGAWRTEALGRLLEAPQLEVQLDSARLALACGVHEESAILVLSRSLELREDVPSRSPRDHLFDWMFRAVEWIEQRALPSTDFKSLEILAHWSERADFTAMHALCCHRPTLGFSRLAKWLEDEDWERCRRAVEILTSRGEHSEAIQSAIESRLNSAPVHQLEYITHLASTLGIDSPALVERVLARYNPRDPSADEIASCLASWLRDSPELWAGLRSVKPEQRELVTDLLLSYPAVPTADNIAFAVEYSFEHAGTGEGSRMEGLLQGWCQSPEEAKASPSRFRTPLPPEISELVRQALRRQLDGNTLPTDVYAYLSFDRLATSANLPAERCVEVLRHAIAFDITDPEGDGEPSPNLRYAQASAACRLLELGGYDERIPSILEAAVRELAILGPAEALSFAGALLKIRPTDTALKQSLARIVTAPGASRILDDLLALLAEARFTAQQRIDILSTFLGATPELPEDIQLPISTERWGSSAPAVLEALKSLGAPREYRAGLLRQFVAANGSKLPPQTRLALVRREELPDAMAAKLLLHVIAQADSGADDAAQEWLRRFTAYPVEDKMQSHWRWLSQEPVSVSLRLAMLDKLTQVKDPAWVESLLVELAGAASDTFLGPYRQILSGGSLSDDEWAELTARLHLGPEDTKVTRLAKEWLTLGLWKTLEPKTITALFRS